MTYGLRKRLDKLDGGEQGKIYRFKMSYGMDSHAIQEEFCRERGIEPKANDLFLFMINFCDPEPSWKYLDDSDSRS
jgi:hypothetical protein